MATISGTEILVDGIVVAFIPDGLRGATGPGRGQTGATGAVPQIRFGVRTTFPFGNPPREGQQVSVLNPDGTRQDRTVIFDGLSGATGATGLQSEVPGPSGATGRGATGATGERYTTIRGQREIFRDESFRRRGGIRIRADNEILGDVYDGLSGATGITLQLAPGPTGATGPPGRGVGATGPRGPTGITTFHVIYQNDGQSGATGATGLRGEQGPRGRDSGDAGATGLRGPTGPRGERGPVGLRRGPTGQKGPTGERGPGGGAKGDPGRVYGVRTDASQNVPGSLTLYGNSDPDNPIFPRDGDYIGVILDGFRGPQGISVQGPSGATGSASRQGTFEALSSGGVLEPQAVFNRGDASDLGPLGIGFRFNNSTRTVELVIDERTFRSHFDRS